MLAAAWTGAIATVMLAIGASLTVYYAKRAFDKQSEEVRTLQREANDQAELLQVQAAQLDAQHDQLHEQQKLNAKQTKVLELQTAELQASLEQRQEASLQRQYDWAATIIAWLGEPDWNEDDRVWRLKANVEDTGDRPVRDVSARWYIDGQPWQDDAPDDRVITILKPGQCEAFTLTLLPDRAADLKRERFSAIIQFRTVGDNWFRAGTDGSLMSSIHLD